jgi:hypothetical protein
VASITSSPATRYSGVPVIISEVTPRSHNRDQECLLFFSEEWNPVRKNPQQIVAFCMLGAPTQWGLPGALSTPLGGGFLDLLIQGR